MSESVGAVAAVDVAPAAWKCHNYGFFHFLYFLIYYFSVIAARELLLVASQNTLRRMLITKLTRNTMINLMLKF